MGSFAAVEPALPGGLRYRELSEGNGAPPSRTDVVTVHYRSRMANGVEFDSSYRQGEPVTFRLDEAIRGWQEALLRMKPGARWQLHVPADYGYRQPGRLAGQALDFDIELLSVSRTGKPAATPEAGEVPPIVLASGLGYQILESGGGLAPVSGENISIRYRAVSADTDDSDATWQRRGQVTLAFDTLTAEWRAVIGRMEEGARWKIKVPAPLAADDPWWSEQRGGLTLEVELLAVTAQAKPLLTGAAQIPWADGPGADGEGMIELAGGLRYRELKSGTGAAGEDHEIVSVHYRGAVQSADEKQELYDFEGEARLQPARLDATWREVIGPMHAGTRWILELPANKLPVLWRPTGSGVAVMELELDEAKAGEDASPR
jgi:FKBP-type peptidyl-prolyl cis-trans isomerase